MRRLVAASFIVISLYAIPQAYAGKEVSIGGLATVPDRSPPVGVEELVNRLVLKQHLLTVYREQEGTRNSKGMAAILAHAIDGARPGEARAAALDLMAEVKRVAPETVRLAEARLALIDALAVEPPLWGAERDRLRAEAAYSKEAIRAGLEAAKALDAGPLSTSELASEAKKVARTAEQTGLHKLIQKMQNDIQQEQRSRRSASGPEVVGLGELAEVQKVSEVLREVERAESGKVLEEAKGTSRTALLSAAIALILFGRNRKP